MALEKHGTLTLLVLLSTAHAFGQGSASWPQWGGPNRNFVVETTGLADAWPEDGPPVIWKRPLGTGHSAIVAAEGRLFTMYRVGNGREKAGPWELEEIVVALDKETGKTLWEYRYPSKHANFNFGAGPHATPLIVGERLFTTGTNKQLHAFDTKTGKLIWSHDLVKELDAPPLLFRAAVKSGYGCSPIAYHDTLICSVGGPGQAVVAFRQRDGTIAWKSGDFSTSEVPPILIDVAGEEQLVVAGGGTVNGLDPATGVILWSHPHDPGNDLNMGTPVWHDGTLVISSAYKAGSRALRLTSDSAGTMTEELWYTTRTRFMFLTAVRIGSTIYGTTGDFGPQFLTALDIGTGKEAWRHRGFGRANLLFADGKAIILDEDGKLALARLTPDKAEILSEVDLFETVAWTVPSLVGTVLYARDRESIVALELGEAK